MTGTQVSMWVYRVPSGYRHDKDTTIRDVLNHEHFDLCNSLSECDVPDWVLDAPARNCVWVCEYKNDALRYADFGDVLLKMWVHNAYIIALDDEGGMLIYQERGQV